MFFNCHSNPLLLYKTSYLAQTKSCLEFREPRFKKNVNKLFLFNGDWFDWKKMFKNEIM